MAEARSFVIQIRGNQTNRIFDLLRDKTIYLNATVDWQGRDRIEFSTEDPLAEEVLLKISLLSPDVEIQERKAGKDREIPQVPVGSWVEGRLIGCPNKNCITTQPKEPTRPRFRIVSWNPATLQCYYCGRCIGQDLIAQQLC